MASSVFVVGVGVGVSISSREAPSTHGVQNHVIELSYRTLWLDNVTILLYYTFSGAIVKLGVGKSSAGCYGDDGNRSPQS